MRVRLRTDFATSWQSYCRHNPGPAGKPAPECMPDLLSLADQADVFVLDGFGVLNVGDDAIPGMPEQVAALRALGKRVVILTNGSTRQHPALVKKFTDLGYPVDDIISSRDVCIAELAQSALTGLRWGVSPVGDVTDPNFRLDDLGIDAAYCDAQNLAQFDAFLMLTTKAWNSALEQALCETLRDRPRPLWCANPDVCAPFDGYFSVEPGAVCRRLTETLGIAVRYCGKPDPCTYTYVEKRLLEQAVQVPKERLLMVGDSPHTDILGAARAGWRTALMSDYGLLRARDWRALLEDAAIWPDFVITSSGGA